LKQLSQLHRALNLVYTFYCTRKHFATTFENIKSAVEGHIKRLLLIEDVAQVKALIPRAITFAYVDEDMLLVTIMGEEDGIKVEERIILDLWQKMRAARKRPRIAGRNNFSCSNLSMAI